MVNSKPISTMRKTKSSHSSLHSTQVKMRKKSLVNLILCIRSIQERSSFTFHSCARTCFISVEWDWVSHKVVLHPCHPKMNQILMKMTARVLFPQELNSRLAMPWESFWFQRLRRICVLPIWCFGAYFHPWTILNLFKWVGILIRKFGECSLNLSVPMMSVTIPKSTVMMNSVSTSSTCLKMFLLLITVILGAPAPFIMEMFKN